MKKLLTLLTLLLCAISMSAASVKIDAAHFPDAAFRGEVLGIDKIGNNNGYLDDAEASKVVTAAHFTTETSIRINSATAAYDGSTNKIQDFTGIKYFTNLKQFGVNSQVEIAPSASYTIDLSGLTKLETVYMNNPMNPYSIHLNLKNCTALKYLNINREQAPITFDITGCKNLESITKMMGQHAKNSDSFSLNAPVADFPKLTSVRLYNNYYLTNITVNAPGLKSLEVSYCNTLTGTNLTIGGCTGLETLKVFHNPKLSNITFNIANFSKLKTLDLSGNNLNNPTFDISKHSVLLSDGDSYFGNQGSSYSANVKMTAAQKANFLASDSKNARVNVTVVSGGSTTDTTKPTLPSDHSIKYSVTSNSIAINWTAATDNVTAKDKLSYRADIKEYGTTTWTTKTLGYATSYTFTGLKPSTKYIVDVYVKDEAGNSIYYGETTITTSAAADVTKPTLPTDHSIKYSVTSSSIAINWTAATDNVTAKDKLIYRADIKENGTSTWTTKTLNYATSYTFTGLKANTKYIVDVYVKDEAGNGIYYGETTITTSAAADVTKPTLPTDHSIKYSVTSSSIAINWTAATDNVTAKDKLSYRADIKEYGASSWTGKTLGYATSYTFTGLKASTKYIVDVYVKDEAGNGIYYGETTITTAGTGTNYPLKIAGTQVTSVNASDILGNGGKVKYDNATHTLTLNNATITSTSERAIETTGSLIIKLVGTNTVSSTSATAIYGPSSEGFTMEIEGSGLTSSSLNVTSGNNIAIYANRARLAISNCTVTAKGATYGVNSYNNSITIAVTAKLSATGTGSGSVVATDGIYYSGLSITKPVGAKIGTVGSNKAVVDASGNIVKTEVVFETVKYGLEIAGKEVTSTNKDNIPVSSGKATFDPATNTLTLNSVTLSVNSDQAIYSSIPLTINLIGTSVLSSTGNYTIECDQNLTIQSASGTGRLEISTNSYCIGTRRSTLIKNCSISATTTGSNMKGFYGYSTADLTIEDATVDVKTASTGKAISDFKTLTLNNVGIATPLNGSYSSTSKCVVTAANVAATEVSIKPYETYNVFILGNPITSLNCTDVVGDGTVVYTPATKTLTLNNANLSSGAYDEIIYVEDQDLTIVLKGNNTITHTQYSAIKLSDSSTHYTLTIKSLDGTGVLNTGGGAVGISTPYHNLVIDNCTVNVPSANYGINGENRGGKLTINNANVTVKSTTAAIKGFADISLTNSFIQSPSGAVVNSGAIVCDGSDCTEVTIKKGVDPTTIAPTVANKTITVVGTTSSSIKLSWNAAADNTTAADALIYTVVYSKKGSGIDHLWKVIGKTTTEITGLEEDTEYNISMWVEDADKNSTDYTPTTAKTAKYVDTVNPTISGSDEITVVKVDYDAIKLSWNAASDNTTAANKIVYEISYKHDGITATDYVTGTTETTLSGLSDETEYEISIKAYDEAGNFVTYKTVKVTTPQGPDFEAPILPADISVTLVDVTPTTAKISWNPATDKRSTTLYYEVYYTVDGTSWNVGDGNSDCTYEFTGLTPSTTYTVQVSVGDEAKNYSNYAELTFTTPAIPSAIDAILAKDPDAKMYSLDGKLVDKNTYRGIVIINGNKYMKKK